MLCKSTELVITGLQLWPGPLSETHPRWCKFTAFLIPRGSLGTAHCSPRTPLSNSTQAAASRRSSVDWNVSHFVWSFGLAWL